MGGHKQDKSVEEREIRFFHFRTLISIDVFFDCLNESACISKKVESINQSVIGSEYIQYQLNRF